MTLRWNSTVDQVFKTPEFQKIKDDLKQKLKEEAHIYKRYDAKFPYEMNPSPARTKRIIIEQINLIRQKRITHEEQMEREKEYLNDMIKEYEEDNYGS